MNLLALDTSSLSCTVAVQAGDSIAARHEERPREHTRLLVPMINDAMDEAGLQPADLDAIVLGNGPGSFIGMRIAASIAQGLAFAARVGVIPVSSMLAIAVQVVVEQGADAVAVCQDAHMNEVYLGLFERSAGAGSRRIGAERLHDQSAIPELRHRAGDFVAAGFGWQRYPALLGANRDVLQRVSDVCYPDARFLLPAGRELFRNGAAIEPQHVEPAYIRQKVAEKPAAAVP